MTTLAGTTEAPHTDPSRDPLPRRAVTFLRTHEERMWHWGGRAAAVIPLVALGFALTVLIVKAMPAVRVNGLGFLTRTSWNPGSTYGATVRTNGVAHPLNVSYGAWPMVVGTVQSSVIAVVLAVPLAVGAAFALTERIPRWLSRPLGFTIEVLAGIPSVIIGLWGVLTFGPWLSNNVYPLIADNVPDVPVLRYFLPPVGHGQGLATSGIILALMIVPIIAATTRDLFLQVPPLPREGAVALGMTDYEVARKVTLRWVSSGIIGATVLGLARALGETIAVAMVSGAILGRVAPNIYASMTTIAATIVTQLDSASTDGTGFAVATLAEAALVLAVISVLVNVAARLIISRTGRNGAPIGRG